MMSRDRVEYSLNWKIDPDADSYDEVANEIEESQEWLRKEFEEKGYVYVPDGYEEEIDRWNTEAYESAYLKVFGCLPPEDDD
ncbi:hypothetical protein ACQ4PT_067886 [Festuca glaucescens]